MIDVENLTEKSLLIPILSDTKKHYINNRISHIYVYGIESGKEGILNINHNDFDKCINVPDTSNHYVFGKKYLDNKGIEVKSIFWCNDLPVNYEYNKSVRFYHTNFQIKNINDCVPITQFYSYFREIRDNFLCCNLDEEAIIHYDSLVTNLSEIERNGLYNIHGEYEFTYYNPYTLTGRPSNAWNKVNYAAMTTEMKSDYTTRFGSDGILLEFDMKAFHVYLLSKMVNYTWPQDDIYAYFEQFFEKGINAKDEVFHQIYGGISEKYLDMEFFQKVNSLSEEFYKQFINNELQSIYYGKRFEFKQGFSKPKVLNYILQNFETEFNNEIITQLLKQLTGYKSKLILYTYDAFLFDIHKEEFVEVYKKIEEILQHVPFRVKKGKQYHKLAHWV